MTVPPQVVREEVRLLTEQSLSVVQHLCRIEIPTEVKHRRKGQFRWLFGCEFNRRETHGC